MLTKDSVMALGYFDGVHIGHEQVIKKAVEVAKEKNALSEAITFSGKPDCIFDSKERASRMLSVGVKMVRIFNFTDEFKNTPAAEFIAEFTKRYNVRAYVCGRDFTYGKDKSGNAETLKAFCDEKGLELYVVDEVERNGKKVSASEIKKMLKDGDVRGANALLTQPYSISGEVIHGNKIGRKIGFPTANLTVPKGNCKLKQGVYKGVAVYRRKKYPCIINYGDKPTVGDNEISLEVYIDKFGKRLYGKILRVEFCEYLRDIKKFESLDELKKQLTKDKESLK